MLPGKQAMRKVTTYQASDEIFRMIPMYPQGLEDSVGVVPQDKRVRPFTQKVFKDVWLPLAKVSSIQPKNIHEPKCCNDFVNPT
jgi:hypothetical protein